MKEKYNQLYSEMINNQKKFTKEEGIEIQQKQLQEIETQMNQMNGEFNEKTRNVHNQLRSMSTQLNFAELNEIKTKVFEMRNKMIEFEQLFVDIEKRSDELKTKQIQLNQQSCYFLSRKRINEDLCKTICQYIDEKNYKEIESLYCRFTNNFYTCGLSLEKYLQLIELCLSSVNEHSSKLLFEIVIDSMEQYSALKKKEKSEDKGKESIELEHEKIKKICEFMTSFIHSELAIQLPNSVTAYRIANEIHKQYFTE